MNNIFYTYIYLDSRRPGSYKYGGYTFEYEPFYIGKGKGGQYLSHLNEAKKYDKSFKGYNLHKFYKIKNILNENLEPIILKVEENLSEQEAFDLEIWLIWAIGRHDKKLGPLTNHTNGGEGHEPSEESKIKNSESNSGYKNYWYGKHHSEETKEKLRKTSTGRNKKSDK